MAFTVYVHCYGYGQLRLISSQEYFDGDWQYEGSDDYSGYDICYSCELDEYACVKIGEV